MTKNTILLQKFLVNFADSGQNNLALAMSCQGQLMHYGFLLTQDAFEMLQKAEEAEIIKFYNETVNWLKVQTGGKLDFQSLYKNFPQDVMSQSLQELYMNQLLHYWGVKTFKPYGEQKIEGFEHMSYKEVHPCTEDEFLAIFTRLLSVGNSLTPTDTKVIKWWVESGYECRYPKDIPFKENLAVIAALCPTFTVKTVTDCLRVAVGFSGGDVSLPAVPKSLKKKGPKWAAREEERKAFRFKLNAVQKLRVLDLLESSNLDVRDMQQGSKYSRWIRLFEVLVVQAHKETHPKTFHAAFTLRNQVRRKKPDGVPKIRTWQSLVESDFKASFEAGVLRLAERPGVFMRRLDELVRKNPKKINIIFDALLKNVDKTSSKVLFEAFGHFQERLKPVQNRSIFIKGARQRTPLPDLKAFSPEIVETCGGFIWDALSRKYAELPAMGKCWIDENLKNIPLPTNMRSMSESLVPVVRGQRIPMGATKRVIRPFVHWNDVHGTEDIDLHGFLLAEGKRATQFGFNGEKRASYGCYSGDKRRSKGACAEYVDIDTEKAVEAGFKYFVMVLHNFQQKPFSSLNDCYTGFMERDDALQNSSWTPSSVTNAMKLSSEAQYCLVGMYDLETREYIHLDLDWNMFQRTVGSGDAGALLNELKPYCEPPKLSVYDLIRLHVEARGQVSSLDEAETFFKEEDFRYSYQKTLELIG